jgi:hypothetical protein
MVAMSLRVDGSASNVPLFMAAAIAAAAAAFSLWRLRI